ncbi:hypothetical protein QEN19_000073 [Hanseniaspora menglaensis]
MDEIYLINKLRASFLKNSDEISNVRIFNPYKLEEHETYEQRYMTLSKLYVDSTSGKNYLELIKSPPINDDYFSVLAEKKKNKSYKNHENVDIQHLTSDVHNQEDLQTDYDRPYEHNFKIKGFDNKSLQINELEIGKNENATSIVPSDLVKNDSPHGIATSIKRKLSKRITSSSSITNSEQNSVNSKLHKRNSQLRLSSIMNLFDKNSKRYDQSDNERMTMYSHDDLISDNSNRKMIRLKSKGDSFHNNDLYSILSSELDLSKKKINNFKKSVSSTIKSISTSNYLENHSNVKKNKYFSRLFRSKSENVMQTESNLDQSRQRSNIYLKSMMYTDQLFRNAEMSDNFVYNENDDDEDDDDDDDEDDDVYENDGINEHYHDDNNKKRDSFNSVKLLQGKSNEIKSKSFSNINAGTKGSVVKSGVFENNNMTSLHSLANDKSFIAVQEENMFNLKKIGKKLLTYNNNANEQSLDKKKINSGIKGSNAFVTGPYISTDDGEEKTDNIVDISKHSENINQAPYPDLMEVGSFLENNDDLDLILKFDYTARTTAQTKDLEEINENLQNHISSSVGTLELINNNKDNANIEESVKHSAEMYYGDLASSFGESLIDSDFYFEKDFLDNSVPSHSEFIENKIEHNTNIDESKNNEDVHYTNDFFVKENEFKKYDNVIPLSAKSQLTSLLSHSLKTESNSTIDYESIVATGKESICIKCYLEGTLDPIVLSISSKQKILNIQLLALILFKFGKVEDIDQYLLRIVDEYGLPFEGDFGILTRDGMVDKNSLLEELVACQINDQKLIGIHKAERLKLQNTIKILPEEHKKKNLSALMENQSINLYIYGKINFVAINIKNISNIGELISRYCLQRDLDPTEYYIKFKNGKSYLGNNALLKNALKNGNDSLQIIKIKESRMLNFKRLKNLDYYTESEQRPQLEYLQNQNDVSLMPYTLNVDGDYLPIDNSKFCDDGSSGSVVKTNSKKNVMTDTTKQGKTAISNSIINKPFDNRNNNAGLNGLPLNLTEVYYKYTVYRRYHQKVTLLNNKQLKTLAIDGDFIYLVDKDSAPGMLSSGYENDIGNSVKHWYDQQHHQGQYSNNGHGSNQSRTKTFHISQLIKIDKSTKNKLHFKIKFVRAHGLKTYYFESLDSSDRNEIVHKLTSLKIIYTRNK